MFRGVFKKHGGSLWVMINPGTLKPYDPRTLKPWNFQTYNNPQKVQTPDNSKTEILEPLNSEKCGFRNLFGM